MKNLADIKKAYGPQPHSIINVVLTPWFFDGDVGAMFDLAEKLLAPARFQGVLFGVDPIGEALILPTQEKIDELVARRDELGSKAAIFYIMAVLAKNADTAGMHLGMAALDAALVCSPGNSRLGQIEQIAFIEKTL